MTGLPMTMLPGPVGADSTGVTGSPMRTLGQVVAGSDANYPNTLGNMGAGFIFSPWELSPQQLASVLAHETGHQQGLMGQAPPSIRPDAMNYLLNGGRQELQGYPAGQIPHEIQARNMEAQYAPGMDTLIPDMNTLFGPDWQGAPSPPDAAIAKIRALVNGLGN